MKKSNLVVCFLMFFCSLLFSAYDENKFMQAGKAMIQKGQYDQAIKVFNYVIKQNPKNVQAIVFGAFAHLKKGDKTTAKRYLEVAYKMTGDPKIKKQIDALDGQQSISGEQKPTSSQEAFKPFHFGLKAGLNMANLTGADVIKDNSKSLLGLCAGGFISYSFAPWFSLQPEVLFSQKGMAYEASVGTISYKSTYNLNYIEIPMLIKFSIQTGSVFIPVLYIGPAISIKAGASYYQEQTISGETESDTQDISEYINSMDFNLVSGAGFEIKAGPGAITFEARFDMGFTTIWNIEGLPEQPDVKTSVITILAGYSF